MLQNRMKLLSIYLLLSQILLNNSLIKFLKEYNVCRFGTWERNPGWKGAVIHQSGDKIMIGTM